MKNQNIGVICGIVTYNPEIERLKENYIQIKKQVDRVVIYDNGSDNIEDITQIIEKEDVIICARENQGIAAALNNLCEYAYENKYEWIITLDQDSICPNEMVNRLKQHCNDKTAIIGPRIIYEGNEEYSQKSDSMIENVEWVITSGSLTNTKIWKTIGGFDNILFIDKVDTDYGMRANAAGYLVTRDNSVILRHRLGNMRCKKLCGRIVYVTNHNSIRIYYQCRNIIYLGKKVKLRSPGKEVGKVIIKILLYENDRMNKIKNAFKGICDGRKLWKTCI